jgi:hypothetical protein
MYTPFPPKTAPQDDNLEHIYFAFPGVHGFFKHCFTSCACGLNEPSKPSFVLLRLSFIEFIVGSSSTQTRLELNSSISSRAHGKNPKLELRLTGLMQYTKEKKVCVQGAVAII